MYTLNQVIFDWVFESVVFQELFVLWIEQNLQVDLFESLLVLEPLIEHFLQQIDAGPLLGVEVRVEKGSLVLNLFKFCLLLEQG